MGYKGINVRRGKSSGSGGVVRDHRSGIRDAGRAAYLLASLLDEREEEVAKRRQYPRPCRLPHRAKGPRRLLRPHCICLDALLSVEVWIIGSLGGSYTVEKASISAASPSSPALHAGRDSFFKRVCSIVERPSNLRPRATSAAIARQAFRGGDPKKICVDSRLRNVLYTWVSAQERTPCATSLVVSWKELASRLPPRLSWGGLLPFPKAQAAPNRQLLEHVVLFLRLRSELRRGVIVRVESGAGNLPAHRFELRPNTLR